MATREQILRLDERFCPEGFLPGGARNFANRGNAELLSGGMQLFSLRRCKIARIFSLRKHSFGKHLVVHMSANKQLSKPIRSVVATYRKLRNTLQRLQLE